jgi:hypothetical protein
MDSLKQRNTIFFSLILVVAFISRLIPHPPNFTAMGAFLLVGTALAGRKYMILLLAIGVYFLADLILNNVVYSQFFDSFTLISPIFVFIALSYLAIFGIARIILRSLSPGRLLLAAIFSSIAFVLFSNLGFWWIGAGYPDTPEGLMAAYTAALPYLSYDFLANILFGLAFTSLYSRVAEGKWSLFPDTEAV